ncbi:scavenger receptor class F member 2-like [Haliotis asinina]|uniref:scavenger receptor class F member 2-like n=1 Tax=Haliotis asinina TaxID=109174 RepID=UPI0035323BD2
MASLSMIFKGKLWLTLMLVNVKSSESCPEHCQHCDQLKSCLKCIDGFYGEYCDTPCDTGCLHGKCGIDGSCETETCPPDCKDKICLQGSSACVECNDKRYGVACDKTCHGCMTSCFRSGRCRHGCIDGYYGASCNLRCGTDCSEGGQCRMYEDGQQRICTAGCKYDAEPHNIIHSCVAVAVQDESGANMIALSVNLVIVVLVLLLRGVLE